MIRASLAAGFLGGAVVATALATHPAPQVAKNAEPDWVVAHNARQALWSDQALSELNLGVRVRDGEAFVWGPVPTEELAAEAIARVRLVHGVRSVVSEVYVLPADDLLRRKLTPNVSRPIGNFAPVLPEAAAVARQRMVEPVRPIPSRLVDIVEEIRNRQLRFRSLNVEVANGIVSVTASRDRAIDAMEFAEIVSKLPGVANVVIRTAP